MITLPGKVRIVRKKGPISIDFTTLLEYHEEPALGRIIEPMRILITGGTGLISGPTTRQLLERGDSVTHYDLPTAETPKGVIRIAGDRYNHPVFVSDMHNAGEFDCVLDMICYKPEDAESLIHAFRGRAGQIIFCSTVDVYAKPASRYPVLEDEPQEGIGAYAQKKVLCEKILTDAWRDDGLPLTIIRPAATYGPGTFHKGNVVHTFGNSTTFLDRLQKGKPVVVHGDGSSIWVSGFHEDVAKAFVAAVGNGKTIGKSYHVPGPNHVTWNQYYMTVAEILGAPKPTIVHIPTDLLAKAAPKRGSIALQNFQFNNIFDPSAARRDLNFTPTTSLEQGIRRTIEWIRTVHGFDNCDSDPFYDQLISAWERLGSNLAQELAGLDPGLPR